MLRLSAETPALFPDSEQQPGFNEQAAVKALRDRYMAVLHPVDDRALERFIGQTLLDIDVAANAAAVQAELQGESMRNIRRDTYQAWIGMAATTIRGRFENAQS